MGAGGWPATAVAEAEYRAVLGHFSSGVVVLTGGGRRPAGLTCQSFFSLSLQPPLVAFAVRSASASWRRIESGVTCCANILSAGQEALARAFARSGTDKFAGVGWDPGPAGAPRLHGALAWVEAEVEAATTGGDHRLVIARVTGLEAVAGEPLVFYRGGFGSFRP